MALSRSCCLLLRQKVLRKALQHATRLIYVHFIGRVQTTRHRHIELLTVLSGND
ncbi:Uncharacterised protein [Vibrio cholerae]|nr:Uncharacterised protein [Vibrio cholerae]